MKTSVLLSLCAIAGTSPFGGTAVPALSGDYLEVRSCDVYTGPCFANSEMGLTGKEGMLFWNVREGSWQGVNLGGLSVLAVVKTDGTLGNTKYQPRAGEAVLIVDENANPAQRDALVNMARSMCSGLIAKVVTVTAAPIEASLGTCSKKGCASVKAGDLVQITTSCLSAKHDICGNEETFYPPLAKVQGAYPVFTELAAWNGSGLDVNWQIAGKRCGFLASFSAEQTGGPQVALR